MRKCLILILLTFVLSGCGTEETFETIADEAVQPVSVQQRRMEMTLPMEAASPVAESDGSRIYICNGYEICLQTRQSGDLNATVQELSGYDRENLTMLETLQEDCKRYDLVWASAGEIGDRIGRAAILDDGSYHYCLSLLADAEKAENCSGIWQSMFDSFRLD